MYPLTPVQEGMLFHTLHAPGAQSYVSQYVIGLSGRLEPEALRRAWEGAIRRYAVLRTGFVWDGVERPLQVVHREAPLRWQALDWRGRPPAALPDEVERFLGGERARGFDPAGPPLMRVAVLRTGDERWELVWTHHHLLLDGWSISLVLRDVFALYVAGLRGGEAALPPARPYRDYVAWLQRRDLSAAEAYWRGALAGLTAPTALGIERSAGAAAGAGPAFGTTVHRLSAEPTEALRGAAKRHRLTLNTLVQGAWALLLARYSGEDDVVFGGTVSGRPPELAGAGEMVGLFINTLPVRVRSDEAAPVAAWLDELQQRQAEAREHEHSPPTEVQRWSGMPAGLPLFESIVAFENHPVQEVVGEGEHGLRVEGWRLNGESHYPLTLVVLPDDRMTLELHFERRRIDAEVAARVLLHLEAVLEGMAADPLRPLRELSLLRDAERSRVLGEWSAAGPAQPPPGFVHELFAAQAARTPDAPAVVQGADVLSYAELDRSSDRLAHALRRRGVGPEAPVGVCMERGAEQVVALLAVLKAGGVYLPLDTASPPARLAAILADAGAAALVAPPELHRALPEFPGARVRPGAGDAADGGGSAGPPAVPLAMESAAYVVYTSGSTGAPKGVVVTHGNAASMLPPAAATFRAGPGSRVVQATSIGFDVSLLEVFVALLSGAALHVADRETVLAPERLAAFLREREIGSWVTTPALLDSLPHADFPALRAVSAGGERCPAGTAARWSDGGRLMNMYGPTEATLYATAHRCAPGLAEAPPIGRPLAAARAYVLDGRGEPAPAGVPGELYLGGGGVARGYLGRPGPTAERFVPDPFSRVPGARLYRTGDRARWRLDGELEFLGRVDRQVKVRGVRIEPGEVEAALAAHPAVREAVVEARGDAPGGRRLVAWLVAEEGAAPSAGELRAHLAARLPEPMVPGAFVTLERLPLGASGKVDRRALPAPGGGGAAYVAPRTPTEEELCAVWAEVLGVERAGATDSFFELGGHSLLVMRVVSRVRRTLGVELPLGAVFEAPTVEALAPRVEALRAAGAGDALPPVVPVPRDRPLPLSFAQRRLWFVHRLAPDSPAYNMPGAVRLRGAPDPAALRGSLDLLVRRHETLRTVFEEHAGEPVQRVLPPAPVPLPGVDLERLPPGRREAEARRLAAAEGLRPFDLGRGPLLRVLLLRLADDDHVLCFTLHHVVSDGWSMDVLLREVSESYAALARGGEPRLPELPVQYADFAAWQRDRLSGGALERLLGWWRETLAGAPPLLEVPTDRPRALGQDPRAGGHAFAITAELSGALRALGRREGTTPFMTLMAGWQALLGRYAAQDEVVVGTPIAGRTAAETEGLIGFFVNMLPLRTDLGGDPSWAELLARVRGTALGAYQHQELPFERLVEGLGVERSLTHAPVFQAAFALQPAVGGGRLRLGELEMEPFAAGEGAAKFDLDLVVDDGDELRGTLFYRRALFDPETAARMAGHLEAVLEGMAADPAGRCSGLSLLRPAERARVLEAWNPPAAEASRACLHDLFAGRAAAAPGAVALRTGGEAVTFGELGSRAARLARHLRGRGVGPEVRVGVLLDGGAETVEAVLGVLGAGGAYVPLDPGHPPERLAWMLTDAGAAVLVSRAALRDRLPAFGGAVVLLDRDRDAIAREPDHVSSSGVGPENAAYLVYTSGSTGAPKGVVVEHRALAQTLLATRDTFGLGAGESFAALASPAFDIWAFETFAPLLAGGEVLPLGRAAAQDPERLVGELAAADAFHAVPALMREVVRRVRAGPGTLPGPRRIFLGGDLIPPELLDQVRAAFPSARVWTLYGPTEAAVVCAATQLSPDGSYGWRMMGRPLPGTRLYVCDAGGGLLPQGVAGELCIGGAGVARGYLGRPELTAERFVPDPYSGLPGARMYRSGDRTRWRADGELEFLGRTDAQVKVRGFRVEPGEVEAALERHPGVREAVVVARTEPAGGAVLVAYVVPAGGAVAHEELRAHLRTRLPEHMVPGAFVALDALPLTPNGKLDRAALPAPERTGGGRGTGEPLTATERAVAAVWEELLGVSRVGVADNFFDLGGHSLLLAQVHSRLGERWEGVALIDLFEHPTLGSLAAHLDRRGGGGGDHAERGRQRAESRRARTQLHRSARAGRGAEIHPTPTTDE
ncbi:MAG TPA: amino acid adenylation domain-containing protein [Longimicrobiaceae bacterium]|nr:amino acid adenylation domain-containing protein [Longimicrobiaceae bacterium]